MRTVYEEKPFEKMTVGERIRHLRENILKVDRATMGKEAGIKQSILQDIEVGLCCNGSARLP